MPLLASLAVVLCTAMVLITWSVMGGFLARLLDSGRTLIGDVLIAWPNTGFAHYDNLIERLEKDPLVKAASPMIESYGLVGLPDGRSENVSIKGIDGPSYGRVTDYEKAMWWKHIKEPLRKDVKKEDLRLNPLKLWDKLEQDGLLLKEQNPATGELGPAVVLGIEVSGFNSRSPTGAFFPMMRDKRTATGTVETLELFLPRDATVTLSVPPRDSKGLLVDMVSRRFPVANEFYSGIFDVDHKTVLVELGALQKMLRMDAAERVEAGTEPFEIVVDPQSGEEKIVKSAGKRVEDPARVTTVLVRGKSDGRVRADTEALARRCREIYAEFASAHEGKVPAAFDIRILTWEDQNRTLISAVEKETALVLFVFCFVSMTAVFLVLAIFWSMISEKTKDIGTLRAIGASRAGIAWLWLRYGAAIGIVGALLGGALAYVIVTNINPIHEWMGETLHLYIWDPRVYYFTEIPSKVEPMKALYVLGAGGGSSIVGALIPALRAASMDPVKALRFE